MVEAEAVFMEAAEASMVAADLMAAIAGFVAAASMAARGLLAEEVTTKAAGWELAPQHRLARRAADGRSVVECSCRHQRWPVAFVRQRR